MPIIKPYRHYPSGEDYEDFFGIESLPYIYGFKLGEEIEDSEIVEDEKSSMLLTGNTTPEKFLLIHTLINKLKVKFKISSDSSTKIVS